MRRRASRIPSRPVGPPPATSERSLDNLTHALVGAAIARAGADRATPLATATLVLAANAPDVDVAAFARDGYFALAVRRGITHGVPALLVLPFLVAGAALAWDRWVRRRLRPEAPPARAGPLLLWSAVAAATHPVLDWMNAYGMRWWLPLNGAWSYGDALFIIDPWIWLALGGSVFLASTSGRWGRLGWAALGLLTSALVLLAPLEIEPLPGVVWTAGVAGVVVLGILGRPASVAGRLGVARAALAALAFYLGAMVASDLAARRIVVAAAADAGIEVTDLMVSPRPADPFHADVEALTPDGYVPGSFRWLGSPRVRLRPDRAVPRMAGPPGVDPATLAAVVAEARRVPDARHYLVWSRYPYARAWRDGSGWRVRFSDARYDQQAGSGGLAGVEVRVEEGS